MLSKTVANFSCGATVHVSSIKHCKDNITIINSKLILATNPHIECTPGFQPRSPARKRLDGDNISLIGPRVQEFIPQLLKGGNDMLLVKNAPSLGKSKWTSEIDFDARLPNERRTLFIAV